MFGLYGNIYNWRNSGKYQQRYYTLGDANQGLDTLSRELLVRWSREMVGQLPIIRTAIRILADFSIGQAYLPIYSGQNKNWWNDASKWLLEEWYPSANVRGFDFQSSLRLESALLDTDGDYLIVYGIDNGFPKFQIIQNNRLKNQDQDNATITDGPMAGTMVSDGVYYLPNGKAVGFAITNPKNLVNQMAGEQSKQITISARDATLILDPEFIDKLRGVPSIGSAILQALSIQELDSYLMEKIKIESSIALIESNARGQAPVELQNTLQELLNVGQDVGLANAAISPNTHAVQMVQGSEIRYLYADGSDIKSLASSTPGFESQKYVERLETQVLSTIGVPHQLVYSVDSASGRITSSIAEIFRASVKRRQSIYDRTAKLRVAWALAKAGEAGLIPKNEDENLLRVIGFTHPPEFTLDAKYDSQIVIDRYKAGFTTLNDVTTKLSNKPAEQVLDEQANEQIAFYKRAKRISEETGVDLSVVISGWRMDQKLTRPPESMKVEPGNEDSIQVGE